MLSPYRVLDLTDERGQLAGAMLAQLGADVIAVEPPGGAGSRHRAPHAGDVNDGEHSFLHWSYNRGKRSVVLDLAGSQVDRDTLVRLAEGADVLIESEAPGAMARLGLGYSQLAERNPSLVVTSITPFGQTGPRAHWAATDLTVWASAGPLVLTGDDDRAPIRPSVPQAWLHAGAEAAGATIAALYERGSSGLGQHVDVSAQQACAQATQSMILAAPNGASVVRRGAGAIKIGPLDLRLLWPCRDGHVSITFLFGSALGQGTDRFMQWIHEKGYCDDATRNKDWIAYGELLVNGTEPLSEFERVKDIVTAFCADHTKAELLAAAMERRLLIAPVSMIDDVAGLEQFAQRNYWEDVAGVRYPGAYAKLSGTPLQPLGPPPHLGADTARVLAEPVREPCAPPATEPAPEARPLAGVKVLDLMWVMAGPATSRVITDLGATVVRVESSHRIDPARTLQPFRGDVAELENSSLFLNMNAGKLGLALDPSTPTGREVVLDLVRWADVVTESFSPKALRGWDLHYDALREVNPGIVMMSSCLFGQSGPLSTFAGYGTMAAAVSGFFGVTGWSDRAPAGPFGAYTDYISPRFSTAVLLAALDHRRRTGEGQYIDFAQAEAAVHALAPAMLEYTVNGRLWPRVGNHDGVFHPHGVFASAGEDCWIALACEHDVQREALRDVVGDLLDDSISTWTRSRSNRDAAEELQSLGIAAYAVQNSPEAVVDPQLVHRGHFRTVPFKAHETVTIEGTRFKMSRSLPLVDAPGPMLGEHTFQVLTEILGYDTDRVTDLLVQGVVE